ncbi:peptidase [Microbacterium sp. M28]|uniref:peptidase n=1 Tax=Microbacterium sp. M28 TaxID=2962064 RepID=UPI0021F42EC5|nr:peptidase [Microbacterium sp. M28]UYO98333.1 peptidase [Microbacterium sp. M28]
MSVSIDWFAFLQVFGAALIGAAAIVTFYALGLRLLVRSGHAPVVSPAEFTDAITVISEKELRRAEKQAAKAAKKNPLTEGQKRMSLVGAYACFVMCALAVIAGILIIVIGH